MKRLLLTALTLVAAATAPLGAAGAQITQIDPNTALDADLNGTAPTTQQPSTQPTYPTPAQPQQTQPGQTQPGQTQPGFDATVQNATEDYNADVANGTNADPNAQAGTQSTTAASTGIPTDLPTSGDQTYKKDDLIGAAEGVFGKGAQGLGEMLENVLAKQGEPNGYIVGREASGALVVGLRYGSGKLFHKVEGQRDVYWTGPSIGLDTGGNASRSFVLVYNLYDTQDLYKRFPAGEGSAYMVGGLTASYLRRGDVVLIPIRLGVGMRLGVNAGYMKFTEKRKWLPF